MRRDNMFWGTALILVGVLLFLQTEGYIGNIFPYLWPLALILVGAWVILGVYWKPATSPEESFSIPLGAVQSVEYHFSHGAGQLEISGGAPTGRALVGTSAAGMNRNSQVNGDKLDVRVEAGPSFVPFIGPSQGVWRFQLTREIPSRLVVETGASSLNLDLRDVPAREIALKTGASSSNIILPEQGASLLDIEAGAASVRVVVPPATAARIRVEEGVTSINVDTNRFPRLGSGFYQSSGYDTAVDRAEINIASGLGSITVT
jgi:LiaI-LiaF-like transmembrane region